jgi:hypothetical protein
MRQPGTPVHSTGTEGGAIAVRLGTAIVVVALTLLGCAGRATAPDPPPPGAVPDLRAAAAVELGSDELAEAVGGGGGIATLLGAAGFESAVERTYSGGTGGIRRVNVRVVRFDSVGGAERYRSWVSAHASALIGSASPAPFDGATLFLHVPTGCCPHETASALAAWRHGRDVVHVVVVGPEADDAATGEVVESVRRWVDGS